MGWRLAPLGRYLDVRPHPDFESAPLPEAVNIPFNELARRLHELPPKGEPVCIASFGPDAVRAVDFLVNGGRRAVLVQPCSDEEGERMTLRLWRPNAFLESILPRITGGSALDLGCGCGREALAMAAAGFQVIAVDHLPDALDRGRELEGRYLSPTPIWTHKKSDRGAEGDCAGPIEWVRADLERVETPTPGSSSFFSFLKERGGGCQFDLITSFRYLDRSLLGHVHALLQPGGSFLLETFTELHRDRHGKPRQDAHILRLGEAPSLVPGLEIVHFDEDWRGEAHTARIWARKSR